ncbi:MAG: hypothetical protein AAF957_07475 [Planctomycetota bacterium]
MPISRDYYASSFDALNTTVDSLSPEAAAVFTEARAQLDQWIDAKFSDLARQADADVKESQKDLEALRADLVAEQEESRKRMNRVVKELKTAVSGLTVNDQQLKKQAKEALKAAQEVKAELEAREAKWHALGKKAVETVAKTAETVVKLAI